MISTQRIAGVEYDRFGAVARHEREQARPVGGSDKRWTQRRLRAVQRPGDVRLVAHRVLRHNVIVLREAEVVRERVRERQFYGDGRDAVAAFVELIKCKMRAHDRQADEALLAIIFNPDLGVRQQRPQARHGARRRL